MSELEENDFDDTITYASSGGDNVKVDWSVSVSSPGQKSSVTPEAMDENRRRRKNCAVPVNWKPGFEKRYIALVEFELEGNKRLEKEIVDNE